jgi:hypothetical protein
MTPIIVCSKTNWKGLELFLHSVSLYVPRETEVYVCSPVQEHAGSYKWLMNDRNTFGESYNYAMTQAFLDGHETVIIANDDIVLDPTSYWLLTHDRVILRQQGHKVGFVSARSNMASMPQNIRYKQDNDQWAGMKWASEDTLAMVDWTAPLFASVDKEGWVGFPPLNFYSDNVACADMAENGYKHFLSRSYVHHVGSSTIGRGGAADSKNIMEAEDWLKLNRPLLHRQHFGGNL